MRALLYIHDRSFGVCEAPPLGTQKRPTGVTYCCPRCGEVWARFIPVKEHDTQPITYTFHSIVCDRCGSGSLRLWENFPLDVLPTQALVRELDLIIEKGAQYDANRY